jgi:hypothetical protein
VLRWGTGDIRSLFEANGLSLHEWEKERTDRITLRETDRDAMTAPPSLPVTAGTPSTPVPLDARQAVA